MAVKECPHLQIGEVDGKCMACGKRIRPAFSHAGPSISENIRDALDDAVRRWYERKKQDPEDDVTNSLHRGVVRGLATALAFMISPYDPTPAVKALETQSMERVKNDSGNR